MSLLLRTERKQVMQIFELVVDNPNSIIEDIIRKDNNKKKGTQEITKWFTKA